MGRGSRRLDAAQGPTAAQELRAWNMRRQGGDVGLAQLARLRKDGYLDADYRTRVLSIDGGGIRGIIPAMVLAEIERRSGRPTSELFDLIAGTSTGGIIALALTMPDADGEPAWSADDLVKLYEQEGQKIFRRSPWHLLRSLGGLRASKYPAKHIEDVLQEYFGVSRLSEALNDVLVPAFSTEDQGDFFFRSSRARAHPRNDWPLREAARATSAAPTYFPPVQLHNRRSNLTYSLIDGGVFVNNPSMAAWTDAEIYGATPRINMLSLGTGETTEPLRYDKIKNWGLMHWARPILGVTFRGASEAVDYQTRRLVGRNNYTRLQPVLRHASDRMDKATRSNLRALRREAEEMIEAHSDEIDALVRSLTEGAEQLAQAKRAAAAHESALPLTSGPEPPAHTAGA